MDSRHYKGYDICVRAVRAHSGGYAASITLKHQTPAKESEFELPLDEDLCSESEALQEGMRYGLDLVDGLLPWFNPQNALS